MVKNLPLMRTTNLFLNPIIFSCLQFIINVLKYIIIGGEKLMRKITLFLSGLVLMTLFLASETATRFQELYARTLKGE